MVQWFRRRRQTGKVLRLRSREESSSAIRVGFTELAPDVDDFLGQAAYLQLGYGETLSALIAQTPDLPTKGSLSRAAAAALTKHRELVDVIEARDLRPSEVMLPFREQLDAFRTATHGVRPAETMLSVHITAGMLDDFYRELAAGYGDTGRRVERILRADSDREELVATLVELMASDSEWASLLALWGRRLVGDTLLVARSALRDPDNGDSDSDVEPVFTELIAGHARRMAALGLSA